MSHNNSAEQLSDPDNHVDSQDHDSPKQDETEGTSFSFRERQKKLAASPDRDRTPEARQAQGIHRDFDQSSGQKKVVTSAKRNLQIQISEDDNAVQVHDQIDEVEDSQKQTSNLSEEYENQGHNNFEDTAKFRDHQDFKISPNTTPNKMQRTASQDPQRFVQQKSSREINEADLLKQQREIESMIEETKKAMAEDESDREEHNDSERNKQHLSVKQKQARKKKSSSKQVKISDQIITGDSHPDEAEEDSLSENEEEEDGESSSVSEDESEKARKQRAQAKVRAQMPTTRKKKFEVNYTVGRIEDGNAILLSSEHNILDVPLMLLPKNIKPGNILKFRVERNLELERKREAEIFQYLIEPDVEMTNEEHDKGVEESMALAKELQAEDDKIQAEIDAIHAGTDAQSSEGESISKFVNQDNAKLIQEMGFSKIVAEKALFMTQAQGGSVEAALQWIDQHQDDADFNEELRIVGQNENAQPKSNMTKEEKLQKAKELQDAIRKKRQAEEKKLAEEQEKNRVRITKELALAKKKMEEDQAKIEMDRQRREKKEFMDAKKRMLEQLENDKRERLGLKAVSGTGAPVEAPVQPKKDPIEQVKHGLKTVGTLYTEDRQPGIAKTCFKTISVYLTNILKSPEEEKFRKINLLNEAFQKRVGKITGGLSILKGVGFEDHGDQLILEKVDEAVLKETLRLLENKFHLVTDLSVDGQTYKYFSITGLKDERVQKLPYSIRVLLESALRNCDEFNVKSADIETILNWTESSEKDLEIPFKPARVILQDFTGVPAVVDLAAMRDATQRLGGDPKLINPLCPVDLVIDHSIQVDVAGTQDAKDRNEELEFQRNAERFAFLKWGNTAFNNFLIVPPGSGIVHQVNLEYLARVVFNTDGVLYPDSVVGTDSHTTMINGLGVVGWGVGGIEAEAVMLGQTISMVLPKVVGFRLTGQLLPEITATDVVLTITQQLRKRGVVGQFVEFFGPGCQSLTLADRATIANMSPEYGATMGYFPIDEQTLDYLKMTGRDEHKIKQIEQYLRAQELFRLYDGSQPDPNYSGAIMELDLSTIKPCVAGPKRPHDRVELSTMQKDFQSCLTAPVGFKGYKIPDEKLAATSKFNFNGEEHELSHGSVVIAAITSCTNTSNPDVMLAAGILAQNAVKRGLTVKPYIKTSLSPGSFVVTQYLQIAGVNEALDKLGFTTAGYGCMTCIGNSGEIHEAVSDAITREDLVVGAVLSGNRNFEGRVHPLTRANYLASPPLVVAYALAGTVNIDFETQPLGKDAEGNDVFLREIWPSRDEVQKVTNSTITPVLFKEAYDKISKGTDRWNSLQAPEGLLFQWDENSTYIHNPPFFQTMTKEVTERQAIKDAHVLALFGDSITTDHISPAGNISKTSPAAKYLVSKGVEPKDFNSYGARRGNDEIMARGTFANVRLVNKMVEKPGPKTVYVPTGEVLEIFDAAEKYQQEGKQTIIIAGNEYGSGSSRDWAAKGPYLQGVKAVIAQSYERIHRSNLLGMGILPLQFKDGESAETYKLKGTETYTIDIGSDIKLGQDVEVTVSTGTKFICKMRLDTEPEISYYKNGGILPYVLRKLI